VATPPTTTPVLCYADSPIRGELCVEPVDEGTVRVIVPPVRDWRLLPTGYKVASVALLGVIGLLLLGAVRAGDADGSRALCVNAAICAVFLGILIAAGHQRIYCCKIFEVTARSLTVTHVSPGGLRSARTWRRSAIGGVHIKRDNLLIRIGGATAAEVEIFVGERATAAATAEALTAALTAVPAGAVARDAIDCDELQPADGFRRVFFWISAALAVLAMGIGLFGDFCLAAYIFLLAAVPLALAWATE
jgi:hypothetical protein